MGLLIDTNVLSEMRKRDRGNPNVRAWAIRNRTNDLYLSVLVVSEVRIGIEAVRRTSIPQATALDTWLAGVITTFGERILPITLSIADRFARLSVPDRLPVVDGLLAATALVHDLVLVTRNTRDVARTGVRLLNPFEAAGP
jgi:predicted nucleic acid-binding protein